MPSLGERKTIAKYTNLDGYEEWFVERSWRNGFNVFKNVTQSLKMLMKEKIKRNKADKEPYHSPQKEESGRILHP